MTLPGARSPKRICKFTLTIAALSAMVACSAQEDFDLDQGPYPPGIDPRGEAVDGVEVGNRLMAAGEHELALDAFTRAALDRGMTPEVLIGIGTSNMGLGRLGQAEPPLRRAVAEAPDRPEGWNNLGVLLMEKGDLPEAVQVFRKAYALDNGQSDSIRDNLRLALAKSENPDNNDGKDQDFKLVQRGQGEFVILRNP
ncbi:tetratricopeptide repeat protein [Lutimaribacter marinistellae]|uniref:Tetratricopeptide repeat protein n=1 Tax=Lutimaribacter marinistellae TaxID=1820329 RepID=A0ABV7TFG2_9RHOB